MTSLPWLLLSVVLPAQGPAPLHELKSADWISPAVTQVLHAGGSRVEYLLVVLEPAAPPQLRQEVLVALKARGVRGLIVASPADGRALDAAALRQLEQAHGAQGVCLVGGTRQVTFRLMQEGKSVVPAILAERDATADPRATPRPPTPTGVGETPPVANLRTKYPRTVEEDIKLAAELTAGVKDLPEFNQKMLDYARENLGVRLGNGQCTEVVMLGLPAIKADSPREPYVWGRALKDDESWLPGDIIQFESCKFPYATVGAPHHTAVICAIEGPQTYLLHQNMNGSPMLLSYLEFEKMTEGEYTVFRPQPATRRSRR